MSDRIQWEYRVELVNASKVNDALNLCGRDGWQLVAIFPDGAGSIRCVFKRQAAPLVSSSPEPH